MSRIGSTPIIVPPDVKVNIDNQSISVEGKLGVLQQSFDTVQILQKNNEILVSNESPSKQARSKHGLYRSLIANMVEGVSKGFTLQLELVGVGYRASSNGPLLDLSLGFSHNIILAIAPEVKVETKSERGKNPIITLTSHDKQLLGQVAAKIRSFRKPEPYKGKGIRFVGEYIRRKAGKSA
ncbi:MAG: 50S ribosomal protein L6 [Flavobacteriaceae bacterium]|nr:50S ribosomal protein L6 [Flavobacteriaceae bacterium]MCY4268237.1 50S ribosomal protein L6 [Flavobacteriaceae bacterium]MCY4300048.1 50S ribosomal protein L6 [Flavobacteriaceae bacterium]